MCKEMLVDWSALPGKPRPNRWGFSDWVCIVLQCVEDWVWIYRKGKGKNFWVGSHTWSYFRCWRGKISDSWVFSEYYSRAPVGNVHCSWAPELYSMTWRPLVFSFFWCFLGGALLPSLCPRAGGGAIYLEARGHQRCFGHMISQASSKRGRDNGNKQIWETFQNCQGKGNRARLIRSGSKLQTSACPSSRGRLHYIRWLMVGWLVDVTINFPPSTGVDACVGIVKSLVIQA